MSIRKHFEEYVEYNFGGELMAREPFIRTLDPEQLQKVNHQVDRTLERVQHTPPRSVGPLGLYAFEGQFVDRTHYDYEGVVSDQRVQIWRGTATNRITRKEHPYHVLRVDRYNRDYVNDIQVTLDLTNGGYTISEHGMHTTHLRRYNDGYLWGLMFYPPGDAGAPNWYRDTGAKVIVES